VVRNLHPTITFKLKNEIKFSLLLSDGKAGAKTLGDTETAAKSYTTAKPTADSDANTTATEALRSAKTLAKRVVTVTDDRRRLDERRLLNHSRLYD